MSASVSKIETREDDATPARTLKQPYSYVCTLNNNLNLLL